ncbi:MAG: hypothetical protein J5958_00460 [Clostridia bacterium]|nr:hypothetical protein [Clostridia bacterium]
MIWRRLRPASKEDEEEFRKRFEEADPPFKDRLLMVLTGLLVVGLPAALFLVGFGFLMLWIFGAL